MNELLTVKVGDAIAMLAELPEKCCQAAITSPPYWGLRDYKIEGQLGMENTPDEYVTNLVDVMSGVKRALKDDGLLWLNLGDSYAAQRGGTKMPAETLAGGENGKGDDDAERGRGSGRLSHRDAAAIGLKHKDLVMIPSRVALAMQKDGWFLRSMIPWIKRNPMPESVTDRPATAVEYVFLFSKQDRYYYDHDSVRTPYSDSFSSDRRHITGSTEENEKDGYEEAGATNPKKLHRLFDKPLQHGRNRRNSDWFMQSWQGLLGDDDGDPMALVVNTHGFKGAHFATFPEKLVQPMILASTKPGDVILDPFSGAFTTAYASLRLGRRSIAIELNPEFAKMGEQRCSNELMNHLL